MRFVFSRHSSAARKARFYVSLNATMRAILVALSFVLMVAGVLLISVSESVGLGVIGVGIWPLLVLVWYRYELSHLAVSSVDGDQIELAHVLESDVVGALRSIAMPQDLWQAIRGSRQQRFFSIRYGIVPELFDRLIEGEEKEVQKILSDAWELSEKHGVSHISTGALIVSMVLSIPNNKTLLAELGLGADDLEDTVDWLHHRERVLHALGSKSQFGGLARNWTGGYTPILNRFAYNMTNDVEHGGYMHRNLSVHAKTVQDMVPLLSRSHRNVVLVGDLGSGKTTTVYSFAQTLLTNKQLAGDLQYYHVVSVDASSLLTQAEGGKRLESVLQEMLAEAAKAKNIILFFDQASLFFQEGTGSVDIGNVLEPIITNGTVPIVMALESTEWQTLKTKYPSLSSRINQLKISEPSQQSTMEILEDQTLLLEAEYGITFMYQSLKEAYRLSTQYVREIAMPGRAIKVLEMAVNYAEQGIVSERSVQVGVESAFGVRVQATTQEAKKELLDLEEKIHTRMINQDRAVKVVSDALRRSQSGVSTSDRPTGTFLFLGPTGVGKTELAKAIAAEYFDGEDTIIRVDMNEFLQAKDVEHLIDAESPQSMLSQIQRNPFSVVLLDEIEKANKQVVNALLQMLDEGIMRDSKNRDVSFRDSVIIATSNAGANTIRAYIDAGREVKDFEDDFVHALIDSNLFKPEFLNRFDETVVFRPLKPTELLQLVDLLLNAINNNLASKQVEVALTKSAKQWLVDEGYDARLGARPLRRTVQRSVENIVAKRLLEESSLAGQKITLDVSDLEEEVS